MQPLPLSFTFPESMPPDAKVMHPSAQPGDVCNRYGDLRGADLGKERSIVKAGVVWLTPAQAEAASAFGWALYGEWPESAELVQVARS